MYRLKFICLFCKKSCLPQDGEVLACTSIFGIIRPTVNKLVVSRNLIELHHDVRLIELVVNRVPTLDGYIEVEIKDKFIGLEYCIEQTGTLPFLAPALS